MPLKGSILQNAQVEMLALRMPKSRFHKTISLDRTRLRIETHVGAELHNT